ncbi:hypothetical protein V6N12_066907 [Hibiscus sabdariffa]|uniref:Uncharacterized protein n=1 Tax=Hibiscus sabdariffa TaxID=183260 RepID=A0ABR1Z7K8_9ROSI
METKTSAFNCRSSSSIPHSNASLTSPLVNQVPIPSVFVFPPLSVCFPGIYDVRAEHNEENHLHDNGNGNRESEDIGFSQDDDDNNNDADVKYVDNEECGGAGNGRPIVGDEDDNVVDSNFVEEAGKEKHDDGSISKAYECENVAGGQMM